MQPRAAVLVTVYNYGRYLERAMASVMAQSFPAGERELIIVDDGSTDETPQILARYRDRATVVVQPNQGLAAACNAGIRAAKAPLLIRLDADDELEPECLDTLVPLMDADEAMAFVSADRWEYHVGQERVWHKVAGGNIYDVIAPGVLFRKRCLVDVGSYRSLYWEEYDLMIRLLQRYRGHHVQRPLYRYYVHGNNMTASDEARRRGWEQLLAQWGLQELRRWGSCDELELVAAGAWQ